MVRNAAVVPAESAVEDLQEGLVARLASGAVAAATAVVQTAYSREWATESAWAASLAPLHLALLQLRNFGELADELCSAVLWQVGS